MGPLVSSRSNGPPSTEQHDTGPWPLTVWQAQRARHGMGSGSNGDVLLGETSGLCVRRRFPRSRRRGRELQPLQAAGLINHHDQRDPTLLTPDRNTHPHQPRTSRLTHRLPDIGHTTPLADLPEPSIPQHLPGHDRPQRRSKQLLDLPEPPLNRHPHDRDSNHTGLVYCFHPLLPTFLINEKGSRCEIMCPWTPWSFWPIRYGCASFTRCAAAAC
ncbi:hypothetical protein GCM10020220_066250 [Nonomuraea rubra]